MDERGNVGVADVVAQHVQVTGRRGFVGVLSIRQADVQRVLRIVAGAVDLVAQVGDEHAPVRLGAGPAVRESP